MRYEENTVDFFDSRDYDSHQYRLMDKAEEEARDMNFELDLGIKPTNPKWRMLKAIGVDFWIRSVTNSQFPLICACPSFSEIEQTEFDFNYHPSRVIAWNRKHEIRETAQRNYSPWPSIPAPQETDFSSLSYLNFWYDEYFDHSEDRHSTLKFTPFYWDMRLAKEDSYFDDAMKFFLQELIKTGDERVLEQIAEQEMKELSDAVPLNSINTSKSQRGRL